MKSNKFFSFYKLFLFSPLLIYFGKRSPIAYDEGFYILQSKWILESGNWFAPMWWGDIALDRTIGIQYLIALSKSFFGTNSFATYLPVTLGAALMLIFTYKIHIELIGKKRALISPLILSTTFLWINYTHLATQDIIFSSLITFGIFSSIKFNKENTNFYSFLSGLWIGLAFMLKTYLVLIPILGLFPYFINIKIFFKKYFWYGLIVGFFPFLIWGLNIISNYGFESFSGLYKKLLTLSSNNNFTNPFYYYIWNLPINIFPWSIFALFGLIKAYKLKPYSAKYFLFYFPTIVITLLSIFSTKTPYYPIQILSLVSINSYLGLIYILKYKQKIIVLIRYFLFLILPFFFIAGLIYINSSYSNILLDDKNKLLITWTFSLFSFSWLCVLFIKSFKRKIIFIILGPYLIFSIFVQNGILTDRSQEIRLETEKINNTKIRELNKIGVLINDIDSESQTKIIKISVLMPNKFIPIDNINLLKKNNYFLTTKSINKLDEKNDYSIINESEVIKPWKLILKH